MVNPLDVAKSVLLGPIPEAVIDARGKSDENNRRDDALRKDAEEYWRGDRQIIENEWGMLDPQYHQPAPNKILSPEAFETWSHQQIWDALNGHDGVAGVAQGDINSGADGWRRLTEQATNAIEAFRAGVDQDIDSLWSGRAANAAIEATRAYATEFKKLTVSFQMVANCIDLMQGYLDEAKRSVPPPEKVDGVGELLSHLPGDGLLKLSKYRADEAASHAREVMTTVYQPGVLKVDGRTPVLPEPFNPVGRSGTPEPTQTGPGLSNSTPGSVPSGRDPQTVETTHAQPESPNSTDTQQNENESTTPANTASPDKTPQSTDSSDTNPASTTPQTTTSNPSQPKSYLENPVSRLGTPTTSTPGVPMIANSPAPARSPLGGQPAGQPTAAAQGMRTSTQAGRAGTPGMGYPGASRGKGDDDKEHKTPDYLVQDRTTELLGEQPRVLPPGGVIGG